MIEEYEKRKKKQISSMMSLKDYGMGIFILLMGLFFLFRIQLGPKFFLNQRLGAPDALEKIFGTFCLIYGVWRIYRGYKKNYFR
jgi:quinol-cytochrome oxidoreductase complex cytochrome b subunit